MSDLGPRSVAGKARPSRFGVASFRAAWWALRAAHTTRLRLREGGLDAALRPPPPPRLPAGSKRAVKAVLWRRRHTCLVRSIVLQTWLASQGDRRDLIVGVKSSRDRFGAHAWLDGEPPHSDGPFEELLRRPAPGAG